MMQWMEADLYAQVWCHLSLISGMLALVSWKKSGSTRNWPTYGGYMMSSLS
jgi:uncharacterized membrane protein